MKRTIFVLVCTATLLISVALAGPNIYMYDSYMQKGDHAFESKQYRTAYQQYQKAYICARELHPTSWWKEPWAIDALTKLINVLLVKDNPYDAADLCDGLLTVFTTSELTEMVYGDSTSILYNPEKYIEFNEIYAEVYRKAGLTEKAKKLEQEIKELKRKSDDYHKK